MKVSGAVLIYAMEIWTTASVFASKMHGDCQRNVLCDVLLIFYTSWWEMCAFQAVPGERSVCCPGATLLCHWSHGSAFCLVGAHCSLRKVG